MARILIVEDEADLRDILHFNLQQAGYTVFPVATGREALRLARERRPDLVVLDLHLPDIDGTEVVKRLKADSATEDVPVLVLTARGEEVDRVLGFELGAEDYVVKPFSVRELLLRIAALLRRREAPREQRDVEFGLLRVDREAHRAWVDGAETTLTALELRLLLTLHDRKNRVQTRERLLDEVWGIDADITTRTVDTHVKRLREKLGAAGGYIETVRGVGYPFRESPDAHTA